MDSIGFGFEKLDAIGLWREAESGKPIDDRGEVHGSAIGAFRGAAELARKLAGDEQVRACVARQWFRYSLGRVERGDDGPSLAALEGALRTSGRYHDMILATIGSEAFLHRRR
jgi:hypothetical protein